MEIIQWVVACVSVPAAAGCLSPLITRWFSRTPSEFVWPLSFALSIGLLTLAVALIGFVYLSGLAVLLLLIGFWAMSIVAGKGSLPTPSLRRWWSGLRSGKSWAWITIALLLILSVVLAHATYYPFTGDDEISRYAYLARLIFHEKHITSSVRGYPLLLPIAYTITFFAANGIPEQAAKLFPVLFAAMTILSTYALARRWFGSYAGWAAGLTLAATPLFISWGSIGYTDIPCGLYFVLGAYAADVWREKLDTRWALLTGVLSGLAMWVKQAGFAMLPTLIILVLTVIVGKKRTGQRDGVTRTILNGSLIFASAFLTSCWWYLRNAYYDGWGTAIPGAGLYHTMQASPEALQLVPFIGYFSTFGYLTSLLYIAGLTYAVVSHRHASVRWCLLWCIPYTLLWWWRFSYDARFLLTVLPFYAVLTGKCISDFWILLSRYGYGGFRHSAVRHALVMLIAGVGLTQARLGGSIRWMTHHNATYAERLTRAKGDLYPAVEYLRDQTDPSSRTYSTDGRLTYYLIERPITVGYPLNTSELQGYDYFVVGSWAESVYNALGLVNNPLDYLDEMAYFQRVYTGPLGELAVYRILNP